MNIIFLTCLMYLEEKQSCGKWKVVRSELSRWWWPRRLETHLILMFWSKLIRESKRDWERERRGGLSVLTHCLLPRSKLGWSLELWNQCDYPCGKPSSLSSHHLQGSVLAESWSQESELGIDHWNYMLGVGILTIWPNAWSVVESYLNHVI